MDNYYCPYCSSRYQIHLKRPDGVMVCGQCGDPLRRSSVIKPLQITALLTVVGMIAPLIALLCWTYHQERGSQEKKTIALIENWEGISNSSFHLNIR